LIAEDFNFTRIDSITEITVNSSNNPLPQSQILETGTIGSATNNSVIGEQWESMIVSFENLTISDVNADGPPSNFGEFSITDGSGNVRVELQDGNHFYHNAWDGVNNFPDTIGIEENATIDKLTGYLYFSFSFYKLVPRYNTDFEGYQGVVSVENAPGLPDKYQLSQNYPNPFNPSTTISYSIPKEGNVVLKIYNVLGQEIKTLINQFQSAGNYKISFDASFLTSGIYFYSIRSDNFTQVKKMVLVK